MSLTIAVIGAKGFVGGAICTEIMKRNDLELIRVHRGDDIESSIRNAEVIIHSANPSKRFFAKNNPDIDFMESVEKTHKIKKLIKGKKLILISSISARTQLDTVYGRNRRACELIVDDGSSLIIRLGPMFGEGKQIGALNDILNNNTVFLSEKTKYAYVNVAYNAKKVLDLIDNVGLVELGAKNSMELSEFKDLLNSSSTFSGPDDTQIPIDPPSDAPDVREVVDFIEHYLTVNSEKKSICRGDIK